MKSGFLVLAVLTLASLAQAYIPNSRTIVGRVARNDGKGVYVIDQDVTFRTAGEGVTLREHWIIENGETMRVTVTSPANSAQPVRMEILYRDGKRIGPDSSGAIKTTTLPREFAESVFHTRSARGFFDTLIRQGIVPHGFPAERQKFNIKVEKTDKAEANAYVPEPMVRLGRVGGVVAWVFGEPTPADSSKALPGAWIEQDAFVVRKIRFPSEAEVSADRVSTHGTLKLAHERTINWGGHVADVRVSSVKTLTSQQAAPLFNAAAVTGSASNVHLPADEQVKEFYSRFR